jgi:hypothetical protein
MGYFSSDSCAFWWMLAIVILIHTRRLTWYGLPEVWLEALVRIIGVLGNRFVVLRACQPGRHIRAGGIELLLRLRLKAREVLFRENKCILDSLVCYVQRVFLWHSLMFCDVRG